MLPADDAELDEIIETAERESNIHIFIFTVLAALHIGRKVDARHLAHGAPLLPAHDWIGAVAFRMEGDVPGYLLEAVRCKRLSDDLAAQTLFIVAAWCQEFRGGVLPEGLITLARLQARVKKMDVESYEMLVAVALQTNDEGLKHILRTRADGVVKMPDGSVTCLPGGRGVDDEQWRFFEEQALELRKINLKVYHKPILETVPDKPCNQTLASVPIRRSVAHIGRNEPCPCGSGKKYKHCCLEKDQVRLQMSSPVAGRTCFELMEEPEPHLTKVWLERSESYEIPRFNPRKIAVELRPAYFQRLWELNLVERATEALEQLGYAETLKAQWEKTIFFATHAGRKDLLQRLMEIRPDRAAAEADLQPGTALLLAEDEAAKLLQVLEGQTLKFLKEENRVSRKSFAFGLMESRLRGLGILVARGMVPLLSQKDGAFLYEHLLKARDRLNLPPDDPCEDILDRLFLDTRADEGKDAAALREAQRKLGDKVKEVGQLKESLDRMQRDLTQREKAARATEPAPTSVPAAPVAPTEEPTLKELRGKVEGLKAALKERHNERNELRRELQKAHANLEELRQQPPPVVQGGNGRDTDHEEDLLLPQDAPETQPLRVIEFPKHFQDSLASLPRSVGRGTLTMLGRLAAGEPAAFVGAVRLKACPTIMRHRIGIDFRLLFRLLPDRVLVVDLIPRQDLERRIKTLV